MAHRVRGPAMAFLSKMLLIAALAYQCSAVELRMNQIQTLHTHNTYHSCILPAVNALWASPVGVVAAKAIPDLNPSALSYGHAPLATQLGQLGVRSVELDVYYDPAGGRYAFRAGPKMARNLGAYPNSTGSVGGPELLTPGWKVMHIPDFDFQSTCDSFSSCLGAIRNWTKANPDHSPLFIAIEFKNWLPASLLPPVQAGLVSQLLTGTPDMPQALVETPAVNTTFLENLEAEILSVFDRSQIYTPTQFRGGYAHLQARIAKEGWPKLSALKGKVIFRALGAAQYVDMLEALQSSTKGGLVFREESINSVPFTPGNNTVFAYLDKGIIPSVSPKHLKEANITWNNGVGTNWTQAQWSVVADVYHEGIKKLALQGKVLIRAAADLDTVEARANQYGYAAAAAAAGAHFVHTDYPNGEVSTCGFTSTYTVRLQQVKQNSWNKTTMSYASTTNWKGKANTVNLASVCNPTTAPSTCTTWKAGYNPGAKCTCYNLK